MVTTFAGKPVTLRRWETLTKVVLVLYGVFAAVDVLIAVVIGATGTLSKAERVALFALSLLSLPIFAGWLSQSRRLMRSLDDDAKRLGRHWSNRWSIASIVAAFVALGLDHRSPAAPTMLAVSAALAILNVVKTQALVRGVAGGGIAPQAADHQSPPPAAPGPAVRYDALPDTTELAPADDAFWSAAACAGGNAALLETLPTLARRWVELPADGDVTALRASIPAGATLTLWPAPASASKPPAAPEYYGLLQATADGPTRFQLVLPSRVAAFAAETRTARRAALYLPADPAARTALQPK